MCRADNAFWIKIKQSEQNGCDDWACALKASVAEEIKKLRERDIEFFWQIVKFFAARFKKLNASLLSFRWYFDCTVPCPKR